MPIWPFKRSRADEHAELLLDAVIRASRQPTLFGEGRTPDTLEGRFEVVALHAGLALVRLQAEPGAETLTQAFTDKLFRYLDAGLREDGVGDLVVPKRMRKLAGAFYGRLEAYTAALKAEDRAALAAAIRRNVLGVEGASFAMDVAGYLRQAAEQQAKADISALLGDAGWPAYTV
ncbi:MAG: ubiquinol-cytochrome C reductase [Caulobacterales bacterium]|jgi:cytochrome b pre-mRNA-processing protein 3|nr:ubiquinol-cytochrome C reductase [Caulobacterales bacterium]